MGARAFSDLPIKRCTIWRPREQQMMVQSAESQMGFPCVMVSARYSSTKSFKAHSIELKDKISHPHRSCSNYIVARSDLQGILSPL